MRALFKFACRAFEAYLFLFALIPPIIFGVFNTGVAVMLAFALLLFLVTDGWEFLDARLNLPAWPRTALAVALAVSFAGGAGLSALMIKAAYFNPPPVGNNQTAIVLGCQTIGSEPSLMLRYRLNTAYFHLDENPDIPVIVSGGQGDGETSAEAAVMRTYLKKLGIDGRRIYGESRSHNTAENLEFSAGIIHKKSLSDQAVIVTDGFHQFRSAYYARKNGLIPYSLPSTTPWGLLPCYWVREFFGIVKAVAL